MHAMDILVNFSVYRRKEGEAVSAKGLSYHVVLKMVEGLVNHGYIVYTYSSPTFFTDLVQNGF